MSDQRCPSCGATVTLEGPRVSGICAFCETPLVAASGLSALAADAVVPFVHDARSAATRLQVHLQAARWAPEAVRRSSRPDALTDALIPFYSYDATARSTWRGQVGLWYYETKTVTTTVNGVTTTRTTRERHTEWFPLSGSHVLEYKHHLVSGSEGLDEAEANALEPYDLGAALPFAPALLAGRVAERPTVAPESARATAHTELERQETQAIRAFLPGDEVGEVQAQTEVQVAKVSLVLLPVWIASFRHKGKVFRLLVNGQTGEVVGEVPRSMTKVVVAVLLGLGLLVALCACGGLLSALMGGR